MPVVGYIPQNYGKSSTVVFENSSSIIAESFRILRSRMQFLTKEASAPVILITSSMPGEGKTFTAINLASVCSLLGKKTVLLGMDLRKPKIFQDFQLDNAKGISTWLIGQDRLDNIIQETKFENLFIISSGPVPPNPSELIALEKTGDLIKTLKTRFDYVIIDSPPIGIVSDTYHLVPMSDAALLVVRPEHTLKDIFERTIFEISENRTRGVSLVVNDVKADSKHYGYGERYGYTNDKNKLGKRIFRRKADL